MGLSAAAVTSVCVSPVAAGDNPGAPPALARIQDAKARSHQARPEGSLQNRPCPAPRGSAPPLLQKQNWESWEVAERGECGAGWPRAGPKSGAGPQPARGKLGCPAELPCKPVRWCKPTQQCQAVPAPALTVPCAILAPKPLECSYHPSAWPCQHWHTGFCSLEHLKMICFLHPSPPSSIPPFKPPSISSSILSSSVPFIPSSLPLSVPPLQCGHHWVPMAVPSS